MSDKMIKVMKIIMAIQANPGISALELARKCEVSDRTIYRYLRTLDFVAPVTNEGYGAGYHFIGNFALYPLNFTEEEEMVFSILPSMLDKSKLTPEFDSAYDKVMATHVKEKQKRRDAMESFANLIQMGAPAYKEDSPNYLLPIMEAIVAQKTIRVIYHTQSRNAESEREVDPYCLVPREQRFYLIGFCHRNEEIRMFRMSRLRHVEMTNSSFDKGDFNIQQYMKHTWSVHRGETLITFKVKFQPDVARYIKEEEMFVRPKMTDMPDGSLLFEATVNHEQGFLNWVAQYGPSAEILEPQSIREKFEEQLRCWIGVYNN
ncbi:transcriptional regulator [Paenibacillus sp. KS1]|uniref:helix-turn-helix transcriptional regulator n=1 Tax=Paenibacillus sp. KS1 TaxID=1849249 RepID=UPI0008064FF6|nr:WYL domain-containing protein [Paenibacillus sp. KS1]OBY77819.1 transcriptional regulator [Paenibacillus sp. KS1]